jgi:glycosyltransferase involved in cell wall biosynthesis
MTVEIISFGPDAGEAVIEEGVRMRVLEPAFKPEHQLNSISWDLVDALEAADVIHAHQVFTRSGEASILIASVLGKPVFATDLGAHASTLGMRYGMLDLTAGVICISDFSAAMMRTSAPVEVLLGGVDTERFTPPRGTPTREHVLYVGRLLPHKGIDTLIQAMPADLKLIICGTAYDDAYHDHLRSLAAGKAVDFVTGADDKHLLGLYQSAIATVLPSVYRDYRGVFQRAPELLGLTLLESMACGTPPVCSRVGGMPELIRQGEDGFVYDSLEQLTGIISDLRDGRLSAERVGGAARRVAVAEFDIRHVGGKAARLYEAALGTS